MSAWSSVYEKRILLTKLFQAIQSWHQLSVYENKILVQNCLQNEWTLVNFFLSFYMQTHDLHLVLVLFDSSLLRCRDLVHIIWIIIDLQCVALFVYRTICTCTVCVYYCQVGFGVSYSPGTKFAIFYQWNKHPGRKSFVQCNLDLVTLN